MKELLALPPLVLVGLGVLVVVQLAAQVAAVVDAVKRPAESLTLPRVAWILIIVLGELFGPIAYFLAGRRPEIAAEVAPATAAASRAEAAADMLYGAKEHESER